MSSCPHKSGASVLESSLRLRHVLAQKIEPQIDSEGPYTALRSAAPLRARLWEWMRGEVDCKSSIEFRENRHGWRPPWKLALVWVWADLLLSELPNKSCSLSWRMYNWSRSKTKIFQQVESHKYRHIWGTFCASHSLEAHFSYGQSGVLQPVCNRQRYWRYQKISLAEAQSLHQVGTSTSAIQMHHF